MKEDIWKKLPLEIWFIIQQYCIQSKYWCVRMTKIENIFRFSVEYEYKPVTIFSYGREPKLEETFEKISILMYDSDVIKRASNFECGFGDACDLE